MEGILGKNKQLILSAKNMILEVLLNQYKVQDLDCGEFASLTIQNMKFHVKSYAVEKLGHLVLMDTSGTKGLQMLSGVVNPYYKNLPMLSFDCMYIEERRSILIELYDLVEEKEPIYLNYIEKFKELQKQYEWEDMELNESWYDDLRSVCMSKAVGAEEEKVSAVLKEFLSLYVEMEQKLCCLSENRMEIKQSITQDYVNKLIEAGGPSTNMFKAALGTEKMKQFYDNVFFCTKADYKNRERELNKKDIDNYKDVCYTNPSRQQNV
ncbi:hypothetical protein [[Clostridium] polysaccharolyticum]|uniref:Ferredoxin-dependent bilin reductase n=1 Tax=[Clostridium] polysaccharolyticum TaxID=29364 RepID=A0A1I0E1T8_9FIRM|nr:hypothetical protein [[Clostridium] polysaccharolyticum]SET38581.1 Ferredoxin-dependent bilin reductase [[Clostridium] polysaccharolyticum]